MISLVSRCILLWMVFFCLAARPVQAGSTISRESPRSNLWKKLWIASTVALAAGSALDFSSSVGKQELNPTMRGSNGQFSMGRGVAVKGGLALGIVVSQGWFVRRHPGMAVEKTAALTNFATAGVMMGVAIRNRGQ